VARGRWKTAASNCFSILARIWRRWEDLAQVEGHFPGLPIVPGVAQVDWAVKLAARHLGLGIEVAQWFQIKFRRVMVPGSEVTLTLGLNRARAKLAFEYRTGAEMLSSGSIRLAPP
jgi:3-hydroxymyristoyl/3-hydroxydecanoyl-(acyl carrier protein) dehydratase